MLHTNILDWDSTIPWTYHDPVAARTYTQSGIFISLGVDARDCNLPRFSWLEQTPIYLNPPSMMRLDQASASPNQTESAFVIDASQHSSPGLAKTFNGFLLFTALTCAISNLYLASRTLFGLTNQLQSGSKDWYINVLTWFGKTNSYRVPIWAMTGSAFAFAWAPFLQLYRQAGRTAPGIGSASSHAPALFQHLLNKVLPSLSTYSQRWTALVRLSSGLANAGHSFNTIIGEFDIIQPGCFSRGSCMSNRGGEDDYPYYSNGQPLTAYLSLLGCLLILVVVNGSTLWSDFYAVPFLSSYLPVSWPTTPLPMAVSKTRALRLSYS